jgi:hypothetical protein
METATQEIPTFEETLQNLSEIDNVLGIAPTFVDVCMKNPDKTPKAVEVLHKRFNTITNQSDVKIINETLIEFIDSQKDQLDSVDKQIREDAQKRLKYYEEFKHELDSRLVQIPYTDKPTFMPEDK